MAELEMTSRHGVAEIERRVVDSNRVRVRTVVENNTQWIAEDLVGEQVVVDRVHVGREVSAAPDIRREGDVLIVPVVEEVLVVEKRLVLKEELHIRKIVATQHVEEPVSVSTVRAVVEAREDWDEWAPRRSALS